MPFNIIKKAITATGTTTENEPIIKSDGASSDVMQWLSNNEASNITISEDGSNNLDLVVSSGNVGINLGAVAPTASLDVRRGDASGKIAEFQNSTGYGVDIGTSIADAYISSGYAQNLILKTDPGAGQVARLSISSAGLCSFSNGIEVTNSNNYGVVEGNASTLELADDSQEQVADTMAASMLLHIYESTGGNGGLVFCTYAGDPVILADPSSIFSVADTDAKICVIKSGTDSHDVFLKNRLGGTRNFRMLITAGNIDL